MISRSSNFVVGNFVYFGEYFILNDMNGTRGYFVIDLASRCDPKMLALVLDNAIQKHQTLTFKAIELTPAVLDITRCPNLGTLPGISV